MYSPFPASVPLVNVPPVSVPVSVAPAMVGVVKLALVAVSTPVTLTVGALTVPVKVGEASGALRASLPLSLLMPCKIVSLAATVPEPDT